MVRDAAGPRASAGDWKRVILFGELRRAHSKRVYSGLPPTLAGLKATTLYQFVLTFGGLSV